MSNIISNGKLSQTVFYNITDDGTLTVYGKGAIPNYNDKEKRPYHEYSEMLNKIVISDGITVIGQNSFAELKNVVGNCVIPDSVTEIADYAFYKVPFSNGYLEMSENVWGIGKRAFSGCQFQGNLILPDILNYLGEGAFANCYFFNGELYMGKSLDYIPDNAFSYCDNFIGELIFPETVRGIGSQAFYHCSNFTGTLIIPDKVTTVGDLAFDECHEFTGLKIGESVTSIGRMAFAKCYGLCGDIVLPNSVKTIGGSAFDSCKNLSGKFLPGKGLHSIGACAFRGTNLTGKIDTTDMIIDELYTFIGSKLEHSSKSLDDIIENTSTNDISENNLLYDKQER